MSEKSIIKIQSLIRGFLTRKNLRKPKDNMTPEIVEELLDQYNKKLLLNKRINKLLSKKKIRNENFPSEIQENLVKFCLFKLRKIMPCWDTKCGDLCFINKKLEVKGFMTNAPSSFGATESWNWIYFVDCKDTLNKHFKIYEIKLSNKSKEWQNLKINKTQTYCDQCKEKRRPRLKFDEIKKQIGEKCQLIFDGNISELHQ